MPSMGGALTNVQQEHIYKVRVVMGAGTAMTYRSMAATPVRATTTTVVVTFPKSYAEVTAFSDGRFPASTSSTVSWIISTNNIAVDGTITLTSVSAGAPSAPATGDTFYWTFGVSCDQLNDRFVG